MFKDICKWDLLPLREALGERREAPDRSDAMKNLNKCDPASQNQQKVA